MRIFTICTTGNGDPPPKKPPTEDPLNVPTEPVKTPTEPV